MAQNINMKKTINKILKPFGLEIHGKGYLKSLSKGDFDLNEFEFKKKILKPEKVNVIFDVGANSGGITEKYLIDFPNAQIHLFEPSSDLHHVLEIKFKDNPRVVLNKLAVSNKIGNADFYINKSIDTSSLLKPKEIGLNSDKVVKTEKVEKIELITIDHYCEKYKIKEIDILKLDIQGGELSALEGSSNMLDAQNVKLIYSETYFQQQYMEQPLFFEIGHFLFKKGYILQDFYSKIYGKDSLVWCDVIFIKRNLC